MLVLTRKRSQTIRIGENVVIKVIRTGRNAVKIGVQAPDNVRVLRGELCLDSATPATIIDSADCDDDDEDQLLAACAAGPQQVAF